MWGYIVRFLIGVLVSFYFFPAEFTFMPSQNTKKLLAVVGLLILVSKLVRKRAFSFNKDMLLVSIYAVFVSLVSLISIIYNNTPDSTYVTYVVSMWVWLSGAYAVVSIIKEYHKKLSVELVCNYLIGVCVVQCVLAIAIDMSPLVKSYVDRYFTTGHYMDEFDRLYGIGCSLDVAGSRFSTVLIAISAILIKRSSSFNFTKMLIYFLSFVVIGVLGNMIARTTTVGLLIGLIYLISNSSSLNLKERRVRLLRWVTCVIILTIPVVSYYYNNDLQMRENLRFAFEGFFSLFEKGEWDVHSNNRLASMVVFPDNLKTWIIGDGYFNGPSDIDPYYVGPPMTGFYMWTDIGYLRFIFYFGLLGLAAFMLFFTKCAQTCIARFPEYKQMFWLFLTINFIVWLKVSTDIFVVFAIFLCISQSDNDAYEEDLLNNEVLD